MEKIECMHKFMCYSLKNNNNTSKKDMQIR